MTLNRTIPLFLALSATASAWSQGADPCKTKTTTLDANECAARTLAARDKELNAAYQKLLKTMAPADKTDTTNYGDVKKLLLEAQRSWVSFKDNDCKAKYTFYADGTFRDSAKLGCLTEHTELRTKQLLEWTDGT